MSSLLRPLRYLTVRRSLHSRPIRLPATRFPPAFARTITLDSSSQQSSDIPEPPNFEIVAGSSKHPFASIPEPRDFPPSHETDSPDAEGSSSSSEASSSTSVTSLPLPPVLSPAAPPPHLRHPFDTHAFVSYLEKSEIPNSDAVTLMEAVRTLIIHRKDKAREVMLDKEDMENAAYLFRAALSELRTELSVRARNDSLSLKQTAGTIRREVDGLEQKLKEDVQTLKHDIEMDMNNRKSETRSEMKTFDIQIEEENNKFTISLGDLRTEIETTKWELTRRAITGVVLIVVFGVGITLYMSIPDPATKAAAAPAKSLAPATEMRDEAVGTEDLMEEFQDTEKKLEKLLSHREIPVTRKRRDSKAKAQEVDVPRI